MTERERLNPMVLTPEEAENFDFSGYLITNLYWKCNYDPDDKKVAGVTSHKDGSYTVKFSDNSRLVVSREDAVRCEFYLGFKSKSNKSSPR